MHRSSRLFERRAHRIQIVRIDQLQPDRLVRGVALEIHQGMVARVTANFGPVTAEISGLALAGHQLQANDVG